MEADSDARAYEALSTHPRLESLAALTWTLMSAAAEARRVDVAAERVMELAKEQGIAREEAATTFGNVLDVLERGPQDDAERALACAMAAHSVAVRVRKGDPIDGGDDGHGQDPQPLAARLLWLALHTPFDATGLLDQALGDAAGPIWNGVGERIRRFDR
jgi:hypothetical protein